jgi:hypothetical protein
MLMQLLLLLLFTCGSWPVEAAAARLQGCMLQNNWNACMLLLLLLLLFTCGSWPALTA